jgi:hypothetical protein
VSYWDQKDSDLTGALMTAPDGVTSRAAGSGNKTGRVVHLAADSGGPVPVGAYGGLTATAGVANNHATMWTIVLRPS